MKATIVRNKDGEARLYLELETAEEREFFALHAPPDGDYLLRVRGIDAERLEGIDGERRITVDARPVPPSLLEPAAEAKLHGAPPTLWWSTPSGIDRFHVQIARDAAFEDLLIDEPALGPQRFTLAAEPPPGTYYWRAASIEANGEHGPFGDARSFRVLAVPAGVPAGRYVSGPLPSARHKKLVDASPLPTISSRTDSPWLAAATLPNTTAESASWSRSRAALISNTR